jgi:hypothetical protein
MSDTLGIRVRPWGGIGLRLAPADVCGTFAATSQPVLGHLRFLLEDIRPELQQYFIEPRPGLLGPAGGGRAGPAADARLAFRSSLVGFDNGRLGMVKLEMEQVGLPEYGTVLENPDFAAVGRALGLSGIRVTDPADVDDAVRQAFATEGPVLLDVVTNADEVALPPRPTLEQGWGFAIAKNKEFLDSRA